MRTILVAAVMACAACGVGGNKNWKSTGQALTCDNGETAVYTNRFTPQSGGSGVATGADAAAGKINSDGSSGGSPGGAPPGADPGSPGPAPAPDPQTPDAGEALTAMVASCGVTQCAPGQVAVEFPATPAGGGIATGAAVDDAALPPEPAPEPTDPPAPTVKCAEPPPTCPPGLSPQYTGHDTWECTDCALVVTYGGIYGNYRRCVNSPTIVCPEGQVPTWSYEGEIWECKDTCDNGMYDQHTIQGPC
jgi:hypothetical protein